MKKKVDSLKLTSTAGGAVIDGSQGITHAADIVNGMPERRITTWLRNTHPASAATYTALAAFCLYTCVYAFRKTFAAATFDGMVYAGVTYKVWLVIFQVAGYGLSKFIGIKVIAELKAHARATGILLLIAVAGMSLLFFALAPPPYNIVFLFFNGLPLGMVWGMVFGYLEGRRTTEALGAALSVSFIFSSGLCRSLGAYLLAAGVAERWMPFVAALLFTLPLLLFLYLLDQVPPPTAEDERLRTRRQPMNGAERRKFIATFLPGIILFVMCYVLLTVFRDFRDNFSAEVWKGLGLGNSPALYTATEIPVSIAVLIIMSTLMLIRDNMKALLMNHVIIAAGLILVGIATALFEQQYIGAPLWMTLIGLGLYMGYVPFNSIFFDRLIGAFTYAGTVGFIMYVADSCGYLGSMAVVLFKEFGYRDVSWVDVFINAGYWLSVAGTALALGSMIYFHFKHRRWTADLITRQ